VQLAYVILLPDDVHNFMRGVQADLYGRYEGNRTTLSLEPHVTLKQPFDTDALDRYERYFDQLAAETDPFEIVMRGFGFFDAEGVVFLDVDQDGRLLALQHKILSELSLEAAMYESGEPVPYHFHGALATALSPDDLGDARATFSDTPEFRFPLERLGLFRYTEDTWTLYKRAKL
jgi:2'-5' RNA ligase